MQPGRYEKRSAAAVVVMLTSPDPVFPTELTLTENISACRHQEFFVCVRTIDLGGVEERDAAFDSGARSSPACLWVGRS
jgi:hypothetical protein